MYFANPWGLLGLALLPTIVFIHLFQRRFPPLKIGGLHLWADEEQTKTAGRRLDRLPVTRTLLLELFAALLLTALLARPQLANLGTTTHWVFVLDNSASMKAETGDGASFREQALAELRSRVASSGRNSRVSVILTGRRPMMLAGPAVRWSEAEESLARWNPQDTRHDFQAAWDMAAQLTEHSGKRVFVTDDRSIEDLIPPSFELVSVGQSLANLAIETARWSIDPASGEQNLYLRIRNYSDQSVSAAIVGRSDAGVVFRQTIELQPKSSQPLSTGLNGGLRKISVSIDSQDDRLVTDSNVELIEPKQRTLRVAVTLPAESPGRSQLVRVLRSLQAIEISKVEDADFVITAAGAEPANLPDDCWRLAVGSDVAAPAARQTVQATTGPYLIERRNPLLDGINLQGIIWAGVQETDESLAPMISVDTKILLGQRTDQLSPAYLLNIDIAQSNLTESPDWPILISNFVEACRDSRPGMRRWNYRVNEVIRFDIDADRVQSERGPLTLQFKGGARRLVRARTVEIPALNATGVYQVLDGDAPIATFAVNFFDRQESDLSGLVGGTVHPPNETAGATELTETAPWVWMLLIASTMAVALINWAGLQSQPRAETGS